MNIEFVTRDDLKLFETNLLSKVEQLINSKNIEVSKKWYKTKDMEELFGISRGKQQKLRNGKEVPFSKLGDTIYYSSYDIDQILEANKSTV